MTSRLLAPQHTDVPHATPSDVSGPFWERAAAGELTYQVCTFCECINVPPVEICRDCQLAGLRWTASAGRGTLYSWTVVYRPVTPAFEQLPYAPAIIDLDEGFQLVSNLIGVAPADITANMRVHVEFHHVHADLYLPYFRPACSSSSHRTPFNVDKY
jgi:uncharacterized OB-fold protein